MTRSPSLIIYKMDIELVPTSIQNKVEGTTCKRLIQDEHAVLVRDATQSYNKYFFFKGDPILQNLNINVPTSSVYALLGPSGCGKTTLLKCIVGRLKLETGTILVFGEPPGSAECGVPGKRLGYMPQDLSLYPELSIKENWAYYGKLAGMSNSKIKTQINFLLKFLNLPNGEAKFAILSGGQKRRVSFGAALLHKPDLLIVDEPTVGVDSLLRKRIWEYLHDQAVTHNKTIIITTHYIEEARMAHRVGMMHDGAILVEETPEKLMLNFGCNTLEAVFLKLCVDYESSKKSDELNTNGSQKRNDITDNELEPQSKVDPLLNHSSPDCCNERTSCNNLHSVSPSASTKYISSPCALEVTRRPKSQCLKSKLMSIYQMLNICRLYAATWKNIRRTYRDYVIVISLILSPIFLIMVYGLAFSDYPKHISIAIVNHDTYGLGERFLAFIDTKYIDKKPYLSYTDAQHAIKEGDAWGIIYINENFSTGLMERLLHGDKVDNETLMSSIIRLTLESAGHPILLTIQNELTAAFVNFGTTVLTRTGLNPALSQLPLLFDENVHGKEVPTFLDFAAPGMSVSCIHIVAICLTILSFFLERLTGQLERSSIAGLTALETTLSFIISSFTVIILQVVLVILGMIFFLQVMCRGSVMLFFLMLLAQGLCGLTFGLFTSSMCDSEYTAVMFAFGGYIPNLFLCGIFWPIEGMPSFIKWVTVFLPQTYAVVGLRDVMVRGWGITYFTVYMGFITTLLWCAILFFAAAIILYLKK